MGTESETGPDTQFEIHLSTKEPEPKEGSEPEDAKLLGELQTETPLEQTENVQNADSEAELQEGSNPPLKRENEDSNGEERVGSIRTRLGSRSLKNLQSRRERSGGGEQKIFSFFV